jgi:Zn-dependent M28 family amino/carboxypeptidase
MLRPSCVLAAALAAAACATVPESGIAPGAISESTLKEVTRTLSLDAFEGRQPGTPGEEKTLAYLVEQLERAGLQPGNGGSWFQDVPLVEITASGHAPLTVAGKAYAHGADWVGVTYREVPRTDLGASEIVFVGYGINAPEKDWNDYAGIDMRGKTALILVNDPDYESESLEGPFNGRAMTYYGRWTYKFEEAARQGAAAALIVHDSFPASYGWNVVESSWSGPQAYAQREGGGADQTQVNGWVQKGVAEEIARAGGRDLAQLAAAAKRPGFRPVPLGVTASTGFDNAIRRFESKNVIGIIPGGERPDEYVLHTAHWDHLGRCTANAAGDDICNGAIDNATGTAALVALGEAHAAAGPAARTLVFLAVTAEESGLLGSAYYAAFPPYPLEKTLADINLDVINVWGRTRDMTVVGLGASDLDTYAREAAAEQSRVLTPDSEPEKGFYYRSDHFNFAKAGVPALHPGAGTDFLGRPDEFGREKRDEWTSTDYHAPSDEVKDWWDLSGAAEDARLLFAIGYRVANADRFPEWSARSEFRAIREKALGR